MRQRNDRMAFRWLGIVSLLLASTALQSQSVRTSQILTLQVMELSRIELNVKALTLTVDQIVQEPLEVAPAVNTTTKLVWTSNGENRKITIASSNPFPRFTLTAEATNLQESSGLSSGVITLSDNDTHDLVHDISRSSGGCVVRFEARAVVRQGTGMETFLITYTITSS